MCGEMCGGDAPAGAHDDDGEGEGSLDDWVDPVLELDADKREDGRREHAHGGELDDVDNAESDGGRRGEFHPEGGEHSEEGHVDRADGGLDAPGLSDGVHDQEELALHELRRGDLIDIGHPIAIIVLCIILEIRRLHTVNICAESLDVRPRTVPSHRPEGLDRRNRRRVLAAEVAQGCAKGHDGEVLWQQLVEAGTVPGGEMTRGAHGA